jgi:hypothetical protein
MDLGELRKVWEMRNAYKNLAGKLEGRKLPSICKNCNENHL